MTKTLKPRKAKLKRLRLPKVVASKEPQRNKEYQTFPLEHYSYSSFTKFSTNPYMFKVNNLNGDQIETTSSPGNVIGRAAHKALETYYLQGGKVLPEDDSAAIKLAHDCGRFFLQTVSDGFIEYNTHIKNRAGIDEKFAFAFFGFLREINLRNQIKEILFVEKMLQHKVVVDGQELPIPIKGSADLVYRDQENRIIIRDHKFTSRFSDEDSIDGAKLIQAAFNYLLVHAELGEAPYSMIYEEFKITENQKGGPQVKEFEIVYGKHPLVFEFFYRFYEDVTAALLGKQVYVPNLHAIYDRDVAILAYIHRLDIDEERDKAFKEFKVDNITDFLKKRIQKDGALKRYLETVSTRFISAKTLNYKIMTIEERIKMKLAEHGLAVEFHDKVEGGSITQYRYEPSIGLKMSKIEAYVKDIEQVVEKSGIRILAPIPNTGLVGFEVPTADRRFPGVSPKATGFDIPLGVDIMGKPVHLDLRDAPHVLIAGATGSGKSVCMSNIIKNVLALPNTDVHLIDPKMVELAPFQGEAASYSYDTESITNKLQALIVEMNGRYKTLQAAGLRNIREYKGVMPYQFVFIDEFAELMMTSKHAKTSSKAKMSLDKFVLKEAKKIAPKLAEKKLEEIEEGFDNMVGFSCEEMITLLAQKGRAAGIHIVMATQRPSVNVISGTIKANFPTRIALRTASEVDSHVIIDQDGAEKLLGKGDMLLLDPNRRELERLQSFSV